MMVEKVSEHKPLKFRIPPAPSRHAVHVHAQCFPRHLQDLREIKFSNGMVGDRKLKSPQSRIQHGRFSNFFTYNREFASQDLPRWQPLLIRFVSIHWDKAIKTVSLSKSQPRFTWQERLGTLQILTLHRIEILGESNQIP